MNRKHPSPVTDPAGFTAALQNDIRQKAKAKASGGAPRRGEPRTGITAAGPVINSPVQSGNTGTDVQVRGTGIVGRILRHKS